MIESSECDADLKILLEIRHSCYANLFFDEASYAEF